MGVGAPAGESPAGRDYSKIRLGLYVVEFVFSLVVLITAAIVIDKGYNGWSEINFALFVGLTFMFLTAFYCFRLKKAPENQLFNLIELISLAIYWVFWLSAAAATASFVSGINSWGSFGGSSIFNNSFFSSTADDLKTSRDSARACCAFCWLTWFLVSASVALAVMEDVMQKKLLTSTKSAAPAAPAEPAAPAVPAAPTADMPAENASVPEAMAKV